MIQSHERIARTNLETSGCQCPLTITAICEICAIIERLFADKASVSRAGAGDEIETQHGETHVMDTLRHIVPRIPGLNCNRGRLMNRDQVVRHR
jgi:hypothetical protein